MRDYKRQRPDELLISFWPSLEEITDSTLSDAYLAGLGEFYDSVRELRHAVMKKWDEAEDDDRMHSPRLTEYTGFGLERGRPVNRNAPPEIIQFLMTLGTSGLAVGVYSLLRLWVEAKNGRKLRIKIGDFEVEGTQMSPEQFQRFVELTMQHLSKDEFLEKKNALKKEITSQGFTVVEQDEVVHMRETRQIRDAVYRSQQQVREKIRERLAEKHKNERS